MRSSRIWPIAKKELFQMLRDRRSLIVVLLTPLMQLILIGYATSGQITNISLAIVDQSHTRASRGLIDAYIASGQFVAGPVVGSLADAKRAIDRGTARAAIIIPPEFERDLRT